MKDRRTFLQCIAGLGASLGAGALTASAEAGEPRPSARGSRKTQPEGPPLPVLTPDVPQLPFTVESGVKVFHLIAEPVRREILPGRTLDLWGYNGSAPGPSIQADQGDRVRILFENRLPEATSIHWHGLEIPVEMDGMPYISQPPVPPGGK